MHVLGLSLGKYLYTTLPSVVLSPATLPLMSQGSWIRAKSICSASSLLLRTAELSRAR